MCLNSFNLVSLLKALLEEINDTTTIFWVTLTFSEFLDSADQ